MSYPIEYPKIETLYNRDEKFKVDPSKIRLQEFGTIRQWWVTEKIDGMNIRIVWTSNTENIRFSGRTDRAQLPAKLADYLKDTFTYDKFSFEDDVILFGEGYGPKINGGDGYCSTPLFRLFDVKIGDFWLEPDSVQEIADKFGVRVAPNYCFIDQLPQSSDELRLITGNISITSIEDFGDGCRAEGIVARTKPLLFDRFGNRVMWKLKFKDF